MAVNESLVCEISASSRRESLSTKKSERERGRRGMCEREKTRKGGEGRDGDGRARKHLQRIGLARVFNPARGFLVGEIKRGQVKRDAKKIARAHARHFSAHVRNTLF